MITVRLFDVESHPNFRTLMDLKTCCRTLLHTREKIVLFLNVLKISLAPTPRNGPFHVMCVRTHTCFENQDATKITSALADSRIFFSWTMVSFFGENIVLGSYDHCWCFTFFSQPIGVGRVNRWTRSSDQRLENYYYEPLALSRHNIDLVFDEEDMKPERLTEAPEN